MALTLDITAQPNSLTVMSVDQGGLADTAGVHPGDTIVAINGVGVANGADARMALAKAEAVGNVQFDLDRDGNRISLAPVDGSASLRQNIVVPRSGSVDPRALALSTQLLAKARAVEGVGDGVKVIGVITIVLSIAAALLLALAGSSSSLPLAIGLGVGGLVQGLLLLLVGSYASMRAMATRYNLQKDGIV